MRSVLIFSNTNSRLKVLCLFLSSRMICQMMMVMTLAMVLDSHVNTATRNLYASSDCEYVVSGCDVELSYNLM